MDVNELNEFVKSEDGIKWVEELKQPLLKNRDDLLSELKSSNAKLSEAEQRLAQTANELSADRSALAKYLIDDQLANLLLSNHVFEPFVPLTVQKLKETRGLSIGVNGTDRIVTSKGEDGKETPATLRDIVSEWCDDKSNWNLIKSVNRGGGAPGSGKGSQSVKDLSNLTGRELAGVSDSDFKAWQQQELKGA